MDLGNSPHEQLAAGVLEDLNNGASVNAHFTDRDRSTPLAYAAAFGQLAAVELFLSRGARVNDHDRDGRTALWQAAQAGLVIENGGHRANETAALQEIFNRNLAIYIRIIHTLLAHSARTEIADKNSATPWDAPAFYGRKKIVQALLEGGANPNHRDEFGKTPMEWASYNGYSDVVELMRAFDGTSTHLPDESQKTRDLALVDACAHKDLHAVERLLAQGADVNAHVANWSPLPEARIDPMEFDAMEFTPPLSVSVRQPAMTRLLLSAGADANGHNENRVTPLMSASAEVAELLLAKGANADATNGNGETLLMYDTERSDLGTMRVLLAHGAQVNARDDEGRTALMRTRSEGILKLLIANSAAINARDNEGCTALSHAAFTEMGEGGSLTVFSEKWARVLLRYGANPNLADNNRDTPLMLLARNARNEFTQGDPMALATYLLESGARLDLRNKTGRTALQIAERSGAKNLTRLFHTWRKRS
jgi:serine/threonine-protein phosphatase 6 regulatory ankyrin repeat subunit A/serine/threonine-protein phosphatase 6 regulatory ankyrin repeat subunit B